MFCESSSKETNPTELAVTASIPEIPPNATVLSSWHACVLSLCLAQDNYNDSVRVLLLGRWKISVNQYNPNISAALPDKEVLVEKNAEVIRKEDFLLSLYFQSLKRSMAFRNASFKR